MYNMNRAEALVHRLLDEAPTDSRKAGPKVYNDEWAAAASVPRSGWREWREAGVQFPVLLAILRWRMRPR
jgi:hypothetical protein